MVEVVQDITVGERTTIHFVIEGLNHETKTYLRSMHALHQMGPDKRIWHHCHTGEFSTQSYYKLCEQEETTDQIFSKIWGNHIPPRASIFAWQVLHKIVPVDTNIQKLGIPMVSKCNCCSNNHSKESEYHIFFESQLAKEVWGFYMSIFNIAWPRFLSPKTWLAQWFGYGAKG